MITAGRLLGLAAAGATLLAAGASLQPAGAQDQACKSDVITATGRAKFRPFTKTKELEGRGSAMTDAIAAWQREVTAKFGEQWSKWSKAEDSNWNCAPSKTAKVFSGSRIECTISGRPCVFAGSEEGGPVANRREGDGRERPKWGPAYGREMAHQDYLADARERAEASALEREEARQRHLEQQRERAEARAKERADARYRYWEE